MMLLQSGVHGCGCTHRRPTPLVCLRYSLVTAKQRGTETFVVTFSPRYRTGPKVLAPHSPTDTPWLESLLTPIILRASAKLGFLR